jgi:hypothetical protein
MVDPAAIGAAATGAAAIGDGGEAGVRSAPGTRTAAES